MREGRYGKFIGSTGYLEYKFIYDYKKENQGKLNCPICNKELDVKTGRYGTFLITLIIFTMFELLIPKQ